VWSLKEVEVGDNKFSHNMTKKCEHINKEQQLCEFGDHWMVWVLKEAGYS